jgi:hypothetical protein
MQRGQQTTRLPVMQEIAGAKRVTNANSYRAKSIVSDALRRYGSQLGAIPGEGALSQSSPAQAGKQIQFSLGGEIASRLAYTQKSRGRTFPGDQPSLFELRLREPLLAAS